MELELVIQLLAAGGAGGVVANYVATASGRRFARLHMLEQMRALSEPGSRHNPAEEARFLDASLSAGVPRALALLVLRARIAAVRSEARARSLEGADERALSGQVFEKAMAEMEVTRVARATITATLTLFAWHPWWTALTWRITVMRARKAVNEVPTACSISGKG